jgi:hypothetical protein
MSWIVTGVLALVVGLVIWTEIRCGRRNKVFHQRLDPEVDALKNSVVTKYRERFGKDPTAEFPLVEAHNGHRTTAKKA